MSNASKVTPLTALAESVNQLAMLDDDGAKSFMAMMDDIEVMPQQRDPIKAGDPSIIELAESMKDKGQLQAIIVCVGVEKKWRLVAGERRYCAGTLNGWTEIEVKNKGVLTEIEISDLQAAENIQRLALTAQEEARQVKKMYEQLGSLIETAKHFNKSESWVSKSMSIADLPPMAQSLIDKGITANRETINAVKSIEKTDAKRAQEIVKELEDNSKKPVGEKKNSREIAEKAQAKLKKEVKKSKQEDTDPNEPKTRGQTLPPPNHELDLGDKKSEKSKATKSLGRFATFKTDDPEYFGKVTRYIDKSYFEEGKLNPDAPKEIAKDGECQAFIENELTMAHGTGKKGTKDQFGFSIRRHMKEGTFAGEGIKAFFLHAFCEGFAGLPIDLNLENYA